MIFVDCDLRLSICDLDKDTSVKLKSGFLYKSVMELPGLAVVSNAYAIIAVEACFVYYRGTQQN